MSVNALCRCVSVWCIWRSCVSLSVCQCVRIQCCVCLSVCACACPSVCVCLSVSLSVCLSGVGGLSGSEGSVCLSLSDLNSLSLNSLSSRALSLSLCTLWKVGTYLSVCMRVSTYVKKKISSRHVAVRTTVCLCVTVREGISRLNSVCDKSSICG